MEFEVLGSFRAVRDGAEVVVRATKPRRLLATLLLRPNRFVSTDVLTEALWDGRPPRSAVANLRTYVLALRELVPGIDTLPGGYRVTVADDRLDSLRAERLAATARDLRRAGDPAGAASAYRHALELWRGAPLEDLASCAAWQPSVARLERLRHTVSDELAELLLSAGDNAAALGLLRDRLAEDPYDEDRWARLVRSLHGTGRRHEARATFRDAVRVLADDLEVSPGDNLRAAGALTTAGAVDDVLAQARWAAARLPYRYFGVATSSGAVGGSAAALDWFASGLPDLVRTLRTAAAHGLHEQVWRLAATWSAYFDLRGPLERWRAAHEIALASARECGSRRGLAVISRELGQLAMYRDDWRTARQAFTAAHRAFTELGDHRAVAVTTVNLGSWHRDRGDLAAALAHYRTALAAFTRLADPAGEAVARNAIGSVWLRRADPHQAEPWLTKAHRTAVAIGDEHRSAHVLHRLAELHAHQGDRTEAERRLDEARTILTRIQDTHCTVRLRTPRYVDAAQRAAEPR